MLPQPRPYYLIFYSERAMKKITAREFFVNRFSVLSKKIESPSVKPRSLLTVVSSDHNFPFSAIVDADSIEYTTLLFMVLYC